MAGAHAIKGNDDQSAADITGIDAAKARMKGFKKDLDAHVTFPKQPRWKHEQDWMNVAHIISAVLFVFVYRDYSYHPFGTSNGRLVSFLDTLDTCYCYRNQIVPAEFADRQSNFYHAARCRDKRDGIRITAAQFFHKFSTSFCISLLLGTLGFARFPWPCSNHASCLI